MWRALVLLAALLSAAPAWAETEGAVERSRQAREIADDLMSPYCPGVTIYHCASPDAAAVRREIRTSLDAGESPGAIRARLEQRFGSQVVGAPRSASGWLLPLALVALVGAAFAISLRRILARPGAPPLSAEQLAELEQELSDEEPHR
jgi:cytochrome c-type biogenesis protein CcmH/NrfF